MRPELEVGDRVRYRNVFDITFQPGLTDGDLGTIAPNVTACGYCVRFDNGQVRYIWGECLERVNG